MKKMKMPKMPSPLKPKRQFRGMAAVPRIGRGTFPGEVTRRKKRARGAVDSVY
jgi:hypothetical protein